MTSTCQKNMKGFLGCLRCAFTICHVQLKCWTHYEIPWNVVDNVIQMGPGVQPTYIICFFCHWNSPHRSQVETPKRITFAGTSSVRFNPHTRHNIVMIGLIRWQAHVHTFPSFTMGPLPVAQLTPPNPLKNQGKTLCKTDFVGSTDQPAESHFIGNFRRWTLVPSELHSCGHWQVTSLKHS